MSVLKVGANLTPYLKSSSIFDGHPNANLASVGTVGTVHTGGVKLGVFETVYDAWAAGLREGSLYALGKKHPTGLIFESEPEEENKLGGDELAVVEDLEEVILKEEAEVELEGPGEVIGATPTVLAEDCEIVVYQVRLLTPFEARLCEEYFAILDIAGQEADALEQVERLNTVIKGLNAEVDSVTETKNNAKDLKDKLEDQLSNQQALLQEAEDACAKEKQEGPGGEGCTSLANLLADGILSSIVNLQAQIADANAEVAALSSQIDALNAEIASIEAEVTVLELTAKNLDAAGEIRQKNLDSAKTSYGSLSQGAVPSIDNMNKIAVGITSLSSTCSTSPAGECCELGENVFALEFLQKAMAGASPE